MEGPAGIGKTRLLDELRRRGQAAGVQVLEARAGLLEREFAFGVVRQLLEPVADPELMVGPAAAAQAALSDAGPTERDAGAAEGSFPILNGLFRLVERIARSGALVLCIDDLQWSDAASLRFTAYVARRVAALPVLIAASIRTGEPDADEALLGELAQEPITLAPNPRPLTRQATGELIRRRLEHVWVVSRLREAADVAMRRGAPDVAMRLLERAQEEPPPDDQRAALAFELGGSAAYLRGPAGVEPLQRAYTELTDLPSALTRQFASPTSCCSSAHRRRGSRSRRAPPTISLQVSTTSGTACERSGSSVSRSGPLIRPSSTRSTTSAEALVEQAPGRVR